MKTNPWRLELAWTEKGNFKPKIFKSSAVGYETARKEVFQTLVAKSPFIELLK